jgi:Mn2+/Fe2+ NRAMP family transporter
MVSAAGSGELLFTPRVGAQYGYALLWALLAAVALKWFINREIGRYAVCTGATVLDGFATLPGPVNWAVWIIVVPQLVVAAVSIAGFASASATALVTAAGGPLWSWTIASLAVSATLVVWGRYRKVERAAQLFAVLLTIAAVSAAVAVSPGLAEMGRGLTPRIPPDTDLGEVLPWLGYMLSGAAGMMWYSYWLTAKGYGVAGRASGTREEPPLRAADDGEVARIRGWLSQMTLDTTVAVVGALVVTIAFLILGTELLRPRGLLPQEAEMAAILGTLLRGVWGEAGFWIMVAGVFIGFFDTLLSDQDGFGRLFANGARILSPGLRSHRLGDPEVLRRLFVIIWVTLVPIVFFLVVGEPVALLKLSGAIEAAHIPVVTALILYLNRRSLPRALRASLPVELITAAAGVFFAAFAVFYMIQLSGR